MIIFHYQLLFIVHVKIIMLIGTWRTIRENSATTRCKENGPRAFWLIEFWCLMNNTIRELISFLVFVFVVHRMQKELDQGNEDATPQKKT
jgi:hypothetical protein